MVAAAVVAAAPGSACRESSLALEGAAGTEASHPLALPDTRPVAILAFAATAGEALRLWRADRVVEGARLEIVCAVLNRTQGSNPWLSAI